VIPVDRRDVGDGLGIKNAYGRTPPDARLEFRQERPKGIFRKIGRMNGVRGTDELAGAAGEAGRGSLVEGRADFATVATGGKRNSRPAKKLTRKIKNLFIPAISSTPTNQAI